MKEMIDYAEKMLRAKQNRDTAFALLRSKYPDAGRGAIVAAFNVATEKIRRQKFIEAFQEVQSEAHLIAREKGWHDEERTFGDDIALMHSELSEALEGFRVGNPKSKKIPEFSEIEEELADVVIRIMNAASKMGFNVAGAIPAKIAFNAGRKYRHGGKLL